MFGAKLLGGAVGLAVAVVILVLVYVYFIAPSGDARTQERQEMRVQQLPNRIYDDNRTPWECTWRSKTTQETDYVNKKTGETMRIYHYSISGNSARTDRGTFRW